MRQYAARFDQKIRPRRDGLTQVEQLQGEKIFLRVRVLGHIVEPDQGTKMPISLGLVGLDELGQLAHADRFPPLRHGLDNGQRGSDRADGVLLSHGRSPSQS